MLFVSYSTRDLAAVTAIVTQLEARGLNCWYAARDIPPAAIFAKAIADAIGRSAGCLAVISPASLSSDAVLRELELASNAGKPTYPLRLEACQLAPGFDYYLSMTQWTEYATHGDSALDRLADSLAQREAPRPDQLVATTGKSHSLRRWALGIGALSGLIIAGYVLPSILPKRAEAAPQVTQQDARKALRELDLDRIDSYLKQGWNPNTSFDFTNETALQLLVETCEWNPAHDREKLVIMARTLIDGGAEVTHRNTFGDTAYSIAAAPRFCGKEHPATKMLLALCLDTASPRQNTCLPHYRKPPA